jgi:hypothetical protein
MVRNSDRIKAVGHDSLGYTVGTLPALPIDYELFNFHLRSNWIHGHEHRDSLPILRTFLKNLLP